MFQPFLSSDLLAPSATSTAPATMRISCVVGFIAGELPEEYVLPEVEDDVPLEPELVVPLEVVEPLEVVLPELLELPELEDVEPLDPEDDELLDPLAINVIDTVPPRCTAPEEGPGVYVYPLADTLDTSYGTIKGHALLYAKVAVKVLEVEVN